MLATYIRNEANIFYSAFNQRRITIPLKINQLLFTWFKFIFNSVLYQRLQTFTAVMDDGPVKV